MEFKIICYTYKMLLDGVLGINSSDAHKNVFINNPFAVDEDPAQIVATSDGKCLGSVYAFPLEIIHNSGMKFRVCAGSTLYVSPENRGLGIGGRLTMQRLQLMKDKIAIASGLSNMSLPIFQKKGFDVFLSKRYIFLQNSKPVVEMFIKNTFFLNLGIKICNFFISLWKSLLLFQRKSFSDRLQIIEVSEAPQVVEDIVHGDKSLFKENHTVEWFNWVLKYSFVEDNRNKQHLFLIKKEGKTIAFFMTKERFHAQASHRGFKNVILGSVIEWGISDCKALSENHLLLIALLSFGKHVDAVEICSSYESVNKYLRRKLLMHVGESNFAIKAADDSPLQQFPEYHKQISWRIRPAASDNSFN